MERVYLDAALYATGEDLHRALKVMLHLPAYYGGNADALYDCLTERREKLSIAIEHAEQCPVKPVLDKCLAAAEAADAEIILL